MPTKYFGFPLTEAVEQKIATILPKARAAKDRRVYALDLFEIITEVSNQGLDYFFIQSLRRAGITGFKIKMVETAMNMGQSAVLSIGKGILKAMSHEQLAVVLDLFEDSMTTKNTPNEPESEPKNPPTNDES
jgi:hypothetical protein